MIQTYTYALSPKTYFRIIAENRLRRFWWLYLLMIIFSLSSLDRFGDDNFITTYIIVSAVYLPCLFIYLYFWATSRKNQNLFLPHSFTVDEKMMTSTSAGNFQSEIPLQLIIKTVERKSYWLLYIAKSQFIYIPKAVFPTQEDLATFKRLMSGTKNK
ncbi:YcxB family protein [Pontibacter indicus]|uniref:YcxB-like protein n=1 Tax=Pontibacter indicus TaxID=1317125 RepID=A0A1R3XPC2_9BACT|nr:YcxB family protein [Pontibacter indicus]SIT93604.1 YcxB-like protein [Pontibacter indicus]